MLQTTHSSLRQQSVVEPQPSDVICSALSQRWGFLHNVALLSGGTALAQGLSIALSPVITRLYSPSNVGDLALFTSFINVVLVGTSLKYELGIVSADNDREAAQIGFLSLLFCVPMSFFSGLLLWLLMRHSLFGFGGLPRVTPLLMIPATCTAGAFVALRYWFIRQARFGFISHNVAVQHGVRAAAQAGLGVLGPSSLGLFLGEMAGRFAGMSPMLRSCWFSLKPHVLNTGLGEYGAVLRKHRKLLVYSLGSSFLDTLAVNIPLPLLVQAYGSDAGGHFGLVQRVLAVPLALVSASVADVFHSRMALHVRKDSTRVLPFFLRTTLFLLVAGGAPAVGLLMSGPRLFGLVFGSGWTFSGTLAAILVPWFLAQFIVSPLSRLVFVLSGQEFKLVYDVFALLGVIAVFVVAHKVGMSFYNAVLALSIVNATAYIVYYLVLLRIIHKSGHA